MKRLIQMKRRLCHMDPTASCMNALYSTELCTQCTSCRVTEDSFHIGGGIAQFGVRRYKETVPVWPHVAVVMIRNS